MSNPIDDYLLEKQAGPGFMGSIGRGLQKGVSGEGLGMLGAHTVMTAGVLGGAAAAQKIYTAITKKRDFNAMMEANPDLKEFQRENPTQFNQHYNSLRGMNTRFGSEPIVAGTYMRQMSMAPATAGKVVVESLGGLPADSTTRDMMTGVGIAQKGIGVPKDQADIAQKHLQTQKLKTEMPEVEGQAQDVRRKRLMQQHQQNQQQPYYGMP